MKEFGSEKIIFDKMTAVGTVRIICNVLFPFKYLEESLLEFHQTLQTCLYIQDKYFKQKVWVRGQFY